MSCPACKEYHHTLFKILIRPVLGKQFGHGTALKGRKNLCHHACIPENLRNINAVHNSGQHTNLVRLCPVNGLTGTASPEITPANDDSNLYTGIYRELYLPGHFLHRVLVKPGLFRACKGLSA